LPGNTPVERRCGGECEVVFFKLQCEWLPGVDPLLDWPGREPRRIGSIEPADWAEWRDPGKSIGLVDLLRLRGQLLVWMARAVPELEEVIERHLRGHTHFTAVFEKIEKNLGADLRLPALAAAYGTTPAAFAMAFTRGTGMGPKEYLTRRLNQEAIQWVINTDLKMGQIADKLRFKDEFYFSRFFQKWNGMPPSRYRQQFHHGGSLHIPHVSR
jgi:AraC-like DNA-binding protein